MRALRLAVIGKGGAGKSTIAGTLARLLARRGDRVLALDSDPMPGMSISLGLGIIDDAMLHEAVEQDDEGRWRLRRGIGAARAVQRYAVDAPDGVRFLQFGKAGEKGLTEVMGSMRGFGLLTHRLAASRVMVGWSVVADLAAGIRQTAFDMAPFADTYLVIVEPSSSSLATARRAADLAHRRGAERISFVASKVQSIGDLSTVEKGVGEPVAALVPYDEGVAAADRLGVALLDHAPSGPAASAVKRLVETLADDGPGRLRP